MHDPDTMAMPTLETTLLAAVCRVPTVLGMGSLPPAIFSSYLETWPSDAARTDAVNRLTDAPLRIQPEHLDFWRICRSACLDRDSEYGQWGAIFLPPERVIEETAVANHYRGEDVAPDEVVAIEFLGDQQKGLLSERGIRIYYPTWNVEEWPMAASSLRDFIEQWVISPDAYPWEWMMGGNG